MNKKTYVVVNKRKLPKGTIIISIGANHYYEGDEVEEGPRTVSFVERGFLKVKGRKVTHG